MALLKSVTIILLQLMTFTTSTNSNTKLISHSVQGIVVDKISGQPLSNIYLYAIKGEEEAISDNKGQFKFVTWQKLPLTLFVLHKEGENIRVVVSNPNERLVIKL